MNVAKVVQLDGDDNVIAVIEVYAHDDRSPIPSHPNQVILFEKHFEGVALEEAKIADHFIPADCRNDFQYHGKRFNKETREFEAKA